MPMNKLMKNKAFWIWYPGQQVAHLRAQIIKKTIERCTYIDYPGNFEHAMSYVYLRRMIVLKSPCQVTWAGPVGRTRVCVNGEWMKILDHSAMLPSGHVEIKVNIDFAQSLPCFFLQSSCLVTDGLWEASLDNVSWVPAETAPDGCDIKTLPDSPHQYNHVQTFDRIIEQRNALFQNECFTLHQSGEIILDFGRSLLGELRFRAQGNGRLAIFVGESLAEAENENDLFFEQRPLPFIQLQLQDADFSLPERTMRYVRIKSEGICTIGKIVLRTYQYACPTTGDFTCDDAQLNDIWHAAQYTVFASVDRFILDGLKRDRLVWALDGVIGLEAVNCLCPDRTIGRNTIVSQLFPPEPKFEDLGIIDYPLYTILGFENDWLIYGDDRFIRTYQKRFCAMIDFYIDLKNEQGFLAAPADRTGWCFLPDWAGELEINTGLTGTPAYVQILLMRALEIAGSFASIWGDLQLARKYQEMATQLRQSIRRHFWDSQRQAFINGLNRDGTKDTQITPYAQIFAILFDLASAEETEYMLDHYICQPMRRQTNTSMAKFWEYLALIKAGRTDFILHELRHIWGGILKRGYHQFFEDIRHKDDDDHMLAFYDRPFGNSLCSCWSGAVPLVALISGVLGISPVSAGYRECQIKPHMGNLNYIKGSVPTPRGFIHLEINKNGSSCLILPPDVRATLCGIHAEDNQTTLTGPGEYRIYLSSIKS